MQRLSRVLTSSRMSPRWSKAAGASILSYKPCYAEFVTDNTRISAAGGLPCTPHRRLETGEGRCVLALTTCGCCGSTRLKDEATRCSLHGVSAMGTPLSGRRRRRRAAATARRPTRPTGGPRPTHATPTPPKKRPLAMALASSTRLAVCRSGPPRRQGAGVSRGLLCPVLVSVLVLGAGLRLRLLAQVLHHASIRRGQQCISQPCTWLHPC
jgi:hypothetical protein